MTESNQKDPFSIKEIVSNPGKEVVDKKTITTKSKEFVEKTAENLRMKEKLEKDTDFQEIADDNKTAVKNTGWISFAGPVLGTVGGPLAAIFNLGLDESSVALLKAVIIGSVIGNLIGGGISFANLKMTVTNRTKMTYLFVMNKLGLLKQKNTTNDAELIKLRDENLTLLSKVSDLESELMDFRIEKKAKEYNSNN